MKTMATMQIREVVILQVLKNSLFMNFSYFAGAEGISRIISYD
jgi:hypothetical protein